MSDLQPTKTPKLLDIRREVDALRSSDEALSDEAYARIISGLSKTALASLLENSSFDAHTKLGNKAILMQIIQEALKGPEHNLVIMTDLVMFKSINEQFGHVIGDSIIRLTAKAFKQALRDDAQDRSGDDVVYDFTADNVTEGEGYRFGGDEFVAILRNGESLKNADHESLVRTKLSAIVLDKELVEAMSQTGIKTFGIRAGYSLVDSTVHRTADDVLESADPKTNTFCEYMIHIDSLGAVSINQVI